MLYFHPTLFLKDERRQQILHDIPVIVLAPNWRSFVSSENRIVWAHHKWLFDILTTKTKPWNRTVWTPASNVGTKNRILRIGLCERAFTRCSRELQLAVISQNLCYYRKNRTELHVAQWLQVRNVLRQVAERACSTLQLINVSQYHCDTSCMENCMV